MRGLGQVLICPLADKPRKSQAEPVRVTNDRLADRVDRGKGEAVALNLPDLFGLEPDIRLKNLVHEVIGGLGGNESLLEDLGVF